LPSSFEGLCVTSLNAVKAKVAYRIGTAMTLAVFCPGIAADTSRQPAYTIRPSPSATSRTPP
jgi:hypothetical protein